MSNTRLYAKEIETAIRFQKTRKLLGETLSDGNELRFTFCDVNDTTLRPYGNLFPSFRLPVNTSQRNEMKALLTGTALQPLASVSKIIVVEIPKQNYGEMMDGKSIELKLPVKVAAGITGNSVTCYGSYYNFNPDLNAQFSDANVISSLFGVEPTDENEFNTNIAYLFSNEIARPKDQVNYISLFANEGVSVTANGYTDFSFGSDTMVPGVAYITPLSFKQLGFEFEFLTGAGYLPLASVLEPGQTANGSIRVRTELTGVRIFNTTNTDEIYYVVLDQVEATSNNSWSKWAATNKFPITPSGSGKPFARLQDLSTGVLLDTPVGIAYLDKGLIVITNETIVNNIDETLFKKDRNAAGVTIAEAAYGGSATDFAQVYIRSDSSKASFKAKSFVTEFTQSYTCLALQNEFHESNNPTFALAYPQGNSNNDNVYVTEVGLYNTLGELIALGKPSRPVPKNKLNVASFRVMLKI